MWQQCMIYAAHSDLHQYQSCSPPLYTGCMGHMSLGWGLHFDDMDVGFGMGERKESRMENRNKCVALC